VDAQKTDDRVIGASVLGSRGTRIGRVEAAFVDYLLVRTASLLPVDLYVPRPAIESDPETGHLTVACSRREAYVRWHRPLRRAPHE